MRFGRLIDNVGVLLLRQLTTWCLSIMLLRYLPRLLGADGLGKITFAGSLMALLLVVTNLGTGTYVTKRVSVGKEGWSQLFWSTCLVRLVLGTFVLALSARLLLAFHLDITTLHVLYLTGATMIVVAVARVAEATIQGMEQMRWLSLSEIVNKATVALLGIGLLMAGYGVVTFAGVILAGYTVGFVANLVALTRFGLERPRFSIPLTWRVLGGGMPYFMATAVLQMYMWSDVTALKLLTRDVVVGWYGAALQLYTTLNFLPLIFATALLPPLSRLFASKDRDGLVRVARSSLATIFLVSLPLAVGLGLLADRAIALLGYPADFDHSVTILRILAANLPLTGLLMILATTATATDRQSQWVKLMGVALVLNLILDVALIELCDRVFSNGGIGAASAFLCAEVFQLCFATRIAPAGIFNRPLLQQGGRAVIATAGMALVVLGLRTFAGAGTAYLALAGALTYATLIVLLGGVRLIDLIALRSEWSDAGRTFPQPDPVEQTSKLAS